MSPKRLLNWLIALTVAAGVLSAPFAAPAVAKAYHSAAGGETHAVAGEMHAMANDMPCCPDEGKDCNSCPLLALCSLSIPVPAPSAASAFAPGETAMSAFTFPDDLLIDGLGARPPDHPPRTNA